LSTTLAAPGALGQVVSEEHRDKAHAAATKVQAEVAATEKAKKAQSKKK
jgi:multidrug resistance efflux pump